MKMKRKDLEEVNDEFSDFSLSSPARKIRRLDAELPPIMEEEDPEVPWVFKHQGMTETQTRGGSGSGPIIEELPPVVPENEERAVVLFKPIHTPLFQYPSSNYSVSVNPDIISGIKNQILWSGQSNSVKSVEDEAARQGSNTRGTNDCLAVVPWIPPHSTTGMEVSLTEVSESMESEDMGEATMDIEEDNIIADSEQGCEFSGMRDGFHQWQQQHCMIPQLPLNTSSPIVWYR